MTRKRFTEKQVIETLWHQGVAIPCFRCKQPIDYLQVQREHLHEIALGGPDVPANCRYSHAACHAEVTNGTKATSAGSSKHRIAKAKRIEREEKFVVIKELSGGVESRHPLGTGAAGSRDVVIDSTMEPEVAPGPLKPKPWLSRKLKSRPFEKGHRPMRRRVA